MNCCHILSILTWPLFCILVSGIGFILRWLGFYHLWPKLTFGFYCFWPPSGSLGTESGSSYSESLAHFLPLDFFLTLTQCLYSVTAESELGRP